MLWLSFIVWAGSCDNCKLQQTAPAPHTQRSSPAEAQPETRCLAACPALSTQTQPTWTQTARLSSCVSTLRLQPALQPSVCSAASGSPSTTTQVCAMIWFVHAACVLQQNSAQLSSSNMSAQRAIPETTPDSRARLVFDAPPQTKMPRNKRLQRNSNVQTKHSAKKHLLLRSCSGKHSNTPLPLQHKKNRTFCHFKLCPQHTARCSKMQLL